jgi:hypothetical protein
MLRSTKITTFAVAATLAGVSATFFEDLREDNGILPSTAGSPKDSMRIDRTGSFISDDGAVLSFVAQRSMAASLIPMLTPVSSHFAKQALGYRRRQFQRLAPPNMHQAIEHLRSGNYRQEISQVLHLST